LVSFSLGAHQSREREGNGFWSVFWSPLDVPRGTRKQGRNDGNERQRSQAREPPEAHWRGDPCGHAAVGQVAALSPRHRAARACDQDARDWRPDRGLHVHQAWDERHPTLGAWPKFNEKAARQAATIAAGEVKGVDPNDAKREVKRQQLADKQCTTLAILIIEDGPYETSLTGRQVVNWKPAMSALRRGLKDHFDLAIAALTRRQIMAAVDKIAKTGKRGAAKDLRKHVHTFLEWCVGEGYVEHNVLAGYRAPKETRAQRVGRRTKGRARHWPASSQYPAPVGLHRAPANLAKPAPKSSGYRFTRLLEGLGESCNPLISSVMVWLTLSYRDR
jgi:type II secretory pathway component PulJ